jgi:hypothetical protein
MFLEKIPKGFFLFPFSCSSLRAERSSQVLKKVKKISFRVRMIKEGSGENTFYKDLFL